MFVLSGVLVLCTLIFLEHLLNHYKVFPLKLLTVMTFWGAPSLEILSSEFYKLDSYSHRHIQIPVNI